jgi:NAD(P)H dehydrogenase (quinone)
MSECRAAYQGDEVVDRLLRKAGSPYGASVISGHPPAGPTEAELAVARFQGKRVTQVAKKLIAA